MYFKLSSIIAQGLEPSHSYAVHATRFADCAQLLIKCEERCRIATSQHKVNHVVYGMIIKDSLMYGLCKQWLGIRIVINELCRVPEETQGVFFGQAPDSGISPRNITHFLEKVTRSHNAFGLIKKHPQSSAFFGIFGYSYCRIRIDNNHAGLPYSPKSGESTAAIMRSMRSLLPSFTNATISSGVDGVPFQSIISKLASICRRCRIRSSLTVRLRGHTC